jgi:putative membrane protein
MRGLVVRWLTLTVAIVATSYLLEGIRISGFGAALAAAAVLGILNAFFRPLAILLTLPINILSLGLFTFVINALMIKIVSALIPGFDVIGFWTAVIGALGISLISWLLSAFVGPAGRVNSFEHQRRGRRHRPAPDDRTIDLEDKGGGKWE